MVDLPKAAKMCDMFALSDMTASDLETGSRKDNKSRQMEVN